MFKALGSTLRRLFGVPEGETDPRFQPVLERQIRRGIQVTAWLGLTGVLVFVGIHLVAGSRPMWVHRGDGEEFVSLADKTFVIGICIALFVGARRAGIRQWGRLLLGVAVVASGFAMALDDVTRGDFTFTVAWLVLVQLVAVGTVPYTPRQSLAVSMAMLGVYLFAVALRPEGMPDSLYEHRLAYFLFATVIVVTLSHYLYQARYGQHRALADLREAQHKLVRHERLAALGQITSGVAHEIQNPLNFVTNFAVLSQDLTSDLQGLLSGDSDEVDDLLDDLTKNASSIFEHGQRASRIVSRMMEHARLGPDGRFEEVDIDSFVEEHVRIAERRLSRDGAADGRAVAIRRKYGAEAVRVAVDGREMGAVLQNLLDNALRAAIDGGADIPAISVSTARSTHAVEIRVADNGLGVPDDVRDRLFEPFFTTRSPGEGTGLGLSLAYDAVTHGHGGTLTVEEGEGDGAVFIISLPT